MPLEEKKKKKKKKKKNDSKSGVVVVVNDPSIRLFGAKISVQPQPPLAPSSPSLNVPSETKKKEGEQGVSSREDHDSICQEGNWYHKKGTSENMDGASQKPDESSAAECSSGSQDKATQPLPCPRCNSTKTKFCYFNNYNVNQPRHFCKNCHRYWTAGGKVRNVSGRKNKTSCPQNQSASASCDGGPASEIGVSPADQTQLCSKKPSAKSQPELMTNGDCPLFESVVTSPALQDTKNSVDTAKVDSLEGVSLSSPSLVFADTVVSENAHVERSEASETAPVEWARISAIGPCGTNPKALPILQGFPRPPWVCPYEIGRKTMACGSNGGGQDIAASNSSAMIFPRVCAPNSVSPLVHPSHWGSDTGIRTLQSNRNLPQELSASNGSSLAHSSQSLGKHSRDVSSFNEENAEKVSVLKTPKMNGREVAANDASRPSFEN